MATTPKTSFLKAFRPLTRPSSPSAVAMVAGLRCARGPNSPPRPPETACLPCLAECATWTTASRPFALLLVCFGVLQGYAQVVQSAPDAPESLLAAARDAGDFQECGFDTYPLSSIKTRWNLLPRFSVKTNGRAVRYQDGREVENIRSLLISV